MATQEEARQEIIDAIVRIAPGLQSNFSDVGDQVKSLAEAYAIVRKREGGRNNLV